MTAEQIAYVCQYVYYEPIKDKFYFSQYNQGDTETLLKAFDGVHFCPWHFNAKWEGSALFYYIGRL